ncbi:restriction endonuclease subunit S [Mycoplasma hafezii]|uniref:restriction endonuclease subunit S n=1 Tax=Mycoplasma hafezii TaxID=525886 RepID=UPI003CF4B5BA
MSLSVSPEVLTNVKWSEFSIGGENGVFVIESTNSGIDKNKLNSKSGNIPYITRSNVNNGINLFITENQDKKYKINKGNCITIGLDTQTVFYQEHDFFTGQNIQILTNENLNKNNSMFLTILLKKQIEKLNWGGNGATLSRLNRTKIILPIDEQGNPNWLYMENFVKNIENKKISEIIKYLEQYIYI